MTNYMQKSFDIVGYTFNADQFCPNCIIDMLPTGEGEEFDGWKLAAEVKMSVEDNLSEIAYAFSIDREEETSFDSSEFPKVIFNGMASSDDMCGYCHTSLLDY